MYSDRGGTKSRTEKGYKEGRRKNIGRLKYGRLKYRKIEILNIDLIHACGRMGERFITRRSKRS